jgi:hypothetical protein
VRPLACSILVVLGCRSAPPPAPPPSDDALAREAATSFLRCYERDGAECRSEDAPVREWAAVAVLALVRDGIPTEIFDRVAVEVAELRDDALARRQLVRTLADHQTWVRTGQCEVRRGEPVGPGAQAVARSAVERLERLGLAGTPVGDAVAELANATEHVATARLIQVDCAFSRRSFFLVLARTPDESHAFRTVALYEARPVWFGLERRPEQPHGRIKLPIPAPNLIDPWIPFYEEQL